MAHFDASHPNYYLVCDTGDCTNIYGISEVYVEVENLFADARDSGWKCNEDNMYFCPECQENQSGKSDYQRTAA